VQSQNVAVASIHRLEIVSSIPEQPPAIGGAEHRYVVAGGLRVHYAEAGEGPPVLLLHGWPQNHHMWRRVIGRLRDRHRLIAPDLRGFGWTDAPGDGYDPATFAADQIALLDALEIERASVLGHDWGGFTAFLLGIAHPDRIGAILACSTPHPWPPLGLEGLDQLWRSWYAFLNASPLGPALMRRGFARGRLLRGNVGDPFGADDVETYAAPLSAPSRVHVTQALYRSYLSSFLNTLKDGFEGARLTIPALLLFGRRDVMISHRLISSGYEGHADRLEVELVPGAGHFLVDEKPELVSERALALFD
jgi:pimeloyl-ACP methyl ester carboxylesterase